MKKTINSEEDAGGEVRRTEEEGGEKRGTAQRGRGLEQRASMTSRQSCGDVIPLHLGRGSGGDGSSAGGILEKLVCVMPPAAA